MLRQFVQCGGTDSDRFYSNECKQWNYEQVQNHLIVVWSDERCRKRKEARAREKGKDERLVLGLIYTVSLWRTCLSNCLYTSRVYRKGKKDGKLESKADRESEIAKFKSNADLWEAKFNITEISRVEYREATRALAKANEELANQQYRAEKDTNDIIAFLKRTDREKTATVSLPLLCYIPVIHEAEKHFSLPTCAVHFLLICLQ